MLSPALSVEQWQLLIDASLAGMVVLSLAYRRLLVRYHWFSIFLAVDCLLDIVLFRSPAASKAYVVRYSIGQAIITFFAFLSVQELGELILEDYPGIATATRRIFRVGFLICMPLVWWFVRDQSSLWSRVTLLQAAIFFQQFVFWNLALELIFLGAYLLHFPVQLRRNHILHAFLLSFYLLGNAALLALFARNTRLVIILNVLICGVGIACFLGWSLFLTRRGEEVRRVAVPRNDPEKEAELLEKLRLVNQHLMRISERT